MCIWNLVYVPFSAVTLSLCMRVCDWKEEYLIFMYICMCCVYGYMLHANANANTVCVCDCKNFNLNEFSFVKVIIDLYANEAKCNHSSSSSSNVYVRNKSIAKRNQIKGTHRTEKTTQWDMMSAMNGMEWNGKEVGEKVDEAAVDGMEMDEMHTHWW